MTMRLLSNGMVRALPSATRQAKQPFLPRPLLQAAGWDDEPHSIAEQRLLTRRQRADIIQQLAARGVDFQTVATQAGKPDADPFDVLCHLAFNAPVLTRRQRADQVEKQQAAYFAPEARQILSDLLEKYAADGELQFTLPDVLKVPPLSSRGNVGEIACLFGGPDNLRIAINQLQTLLYAD
jgi:type I restriction enzyme R subunit